jgi:hypothetical protein
MAEELLVEMTRTVEHLQRPLHRPQRLEAGVGSQNHSGR